MSSTNHSQLSIQEIRALPKVDLHRHLDCSMRWSTMLEIATTLKLDFPTDLLGQKKHFLVTEPMVNLEAVLNKFLIAQKVLASEEILERLAYEVCEDAFNDGVHLLELRYAPTFIASGHPKLTFEKIHAALLKGIHRAEKKWPIKTGLIAIIQRILGLEEAEKVNEFAIAHRDSFVALDLADNEEGFEPRKFAKLFEKAKSSGLRITVHSGEAPNQLAGQWMIDSIEILGAERIGHGVQAIQFPEVIKKLIEKNIVLEICPYSNWLTRAFPTHSEHPLKKLKDAGVKVTINSDDPGMFASLLSDDFILAQQYMGFTKKDFQDCYETAKKASFIKQ